jgi:CheY-like chemotaxis protein
MSSAGWATLRKAEDAGVRVLIVEDGDGQRELLAALCKQEGCDVTEAADGDVGAERFREAVREGRPFGLVILDLAMPRMDGATAARLMREVEEGPPCWIEGYTAHMRHVVSVKTFERAGINHLTSKPVEAGEWRSLIRRLIREETAPGR